jgi:Glycosyl transferase family 90
LNPGAITKVDRAPGSALARYLAERASAAVERKAIGRIHQTLAGLGISGKITFDYDPAVWPSDIWFERKRDGYTVIFPREVTPYLLIGLAHYTAANLYWFDACSPGVAGMSVTLSDGDDPSVARFAPSTRVPEQIAIPDPYFFRGRGFEQHRLVRAVAPNWDERSTQVVWRGGLNGYGKLAFGPGAVTDPLVLARLRLVLLTRGQAGCDVQLSELPDIFSRWRILLTQERLFGLPVVEESWLARKYAIDIDGFSNTWSNLLIRMLYGCCVLKVDSQFGFRQWYYDRIKPFEHYIPVRADMSDLLEKIEWAKAHDTEAREIAAAGQRFAMALDFEAGKRDAVEIISANWDKS